MLSNHLRLKEVKQSLIETVKQTRDGVAAIRTNIDSLMTVVEEQKASIQENYFSTKNLIFILVGL